MKKIRYIIYTLSLIFVLLLVGCKSEGFSISASITSVNTTENEVSFYATVESTDAVVARAIIEKDGSLVQEINPIEVNKTSSYTFEDLLSNTEYTISIQYKFESGSFIRIAREDVKTKGASVSDITITCSDLEVVFDGKVKSLTATTSVEGLSLVYKYSLNGNKVEEPIHPGEYDVDISFAGNEQYNPCSVRKKLIIKKADVSIACEDTEVVYDGTSKSVVATCSVPNASLSYDYYLGEEQVLLPTNVGNYRVVISYAGNEDYNACSIEKSLVINPQPIKIDLHDIEINYDEDYDVATDLMASYSVAFYQGETLLTEKPTLPGAYSAVVTITDPNYVGTTTINLKIKKLDYEIEYMDSYSFLLGDPIEFLVDDFVKMEKSLDGEPVDGFNKVGEYTIKFSITNHMIYNDLEFSIKIIIDTKKHIIVYNEVIYVENTEGYDLYCDTNYDVTLSAIYYLDGIEIPRPTTPGKYQMKLIYEEDSEYAAFEKILNLIVYPSETTISEVEEGIIHTKGTVLAQDETYSYLVDDGAVLFVEDLKLEVGKSYLIIGSLEYVGGAPLVTILKKEEVTTIDQTPLQATLIGYEEHLDEYQNHFISLRGLVIENNNRSYLVIEDGYALPLSKSYTAYVGQTIPLEIQIISLGQSYLLITDGVGTLTRKEELYVGAYLYSFPEVSTALPKTIESTDIHIEYLESSNMKVINPITLKVSQQQQDVVVEVKVVLTLDEYSLEKSYSVLVLKQKEEELMIYSIEMHQQYGDSLLITYGDYEILIDAGDTKDGPYVNQFLKEHISSDNHLDMIIVTHCHSDHMGGLAYSSNESSKNVKALDGIASIGKIIDYGHDRVGNALHNSWVNIRNKYIAGGAEYYPIYNCAQNIQGASSHHQISDSLSLDFIDTLTYALPSDNKTADLNIYSVATLLTYNNFKFFFAGDLEDKGEQNLYNNRNNTPLKDIKEDDIVLYKAAHHGTDPGKSGQGTISSDGGNQLQFLKSLKPDYFFASAAMCSGDNFGSTSKFIGGQPHPYPKCIANFLYFNDNIYFNGTNGTLEFITNGFEMKSIHGYGATTNYLVDGVQINYTTQKDLKLIDTLWYDKYRKNDVDAAYQKIKNL